MTKLPDSKSQVLTVSQAAKFLKVSIDTLRRWDRSGKLTSRRNPGGNRRYSKEDLNNFKKTGYSSNDTLLTVKETAEKLQVSPLTIRRWDNEGKIKVTRDESNYRRISLAEINRILGQEQQTEKVNRLSGYQVEKVERVNSRQINIQVAKFLLYAFAVSALVIFVVGLQLTSTPWGKNFLSQNIYKIPQTLSEDVKKLSQVNQVTGDILGNEFSLPPTPYSLLPTAYSPNLLKNPSFETKGVVESLAFWQLHPNSTNDNTQMSNHTAHSGSYSLLVTADTGGVIQESTKTEAGKNYQLGIWLKMVRDGKDGNNPNNPNPLNHSAKLHLALGPGWDKEIEVRDQRTESNDGWKYYSATFTNPPPGLVPRIYVTHQPSSIFLFLDDAVFSEAESFAGVKSKEYGVNDQLTSLIQNSAFSIQYSTLVPSGGNVLSVSSQGILYPTDGTQTQGGIGIESSRIGKIWGSIIDISQSLSVNEKVDISGKLTANGNVTLGNNDGDEIEVGGRFISDLLPKQSNAVSLGTSTQRWNNLFAAAGNISNNLAIGGNTTMTGSLTISGGLGVSGGSGLSVTGDLSLDGDLDFTGPQNITTTSDNLTVSPTGNLVIDTSGGSVIVRDAAIDLTGQPTTVSANTLSVTTAGTLALDTSSGNNQIRITTGTGAISVSSGAFTAGVASYTMSASSGAITLRSSVDDINAVLFQATAGGIQLSTGSTDNGAIRLLSSGTITLETSQNNNNITVQTGTADFNVNNNQLIVDGNGSLTLAPSNSQVTVTGNVDVSSGLDVTGTTNLGDGGVTNYLSISNTGDLTMNGTSNNLIANNDLVIRSGQSLTLDTSASNTNLIVRTGSGTFDISTGAFSLTTSSYTQTTNGSTTLTIAGNINRTVSGNITDRITGANNYVLRVGDAASDSNANGNDIFLAAEDNMSLLATRYSLTVSEDATYPLIIKSSAGGIQLSTQSADNGNLTLYSAGTLTLDSSRNNTNVLILPGSGNVGIGSTAPGYKLDVGGTLRTTSTARIEGALTVTTGGASVTGDLTLDGDLDFTGAQNITTTSDDLTLSPTGNLIIDTSGGTVYVRDAWEVSQTSQFSGDLTLAGVANQITANNDFILTSAGSLSLDTSANNTNILIDSGTGDLTAQIGSGNIVAEDDAAAALIFRTSAGGIQLSSQSRDNGGILISSAGDLYIDTSFYGTTTYLQGGLVRVGSGGTANNVSGNGALYIQGGLEVDGSVWLGDISSDDLTLTGQIGSSLIPNVGSTYNLGSATNRWAEIFGDTLTVTTLNSSVNNFTGVTSANFTIDTSNVSGDTEDISITFERGTPATNSQFLWDASEKYFSVNAAFNISPDTDISLPGEYAILNVNDAYGGRRLATFSERGTPRAVIDSSGNILLYQSSNIETSSGTLTMRGYSGLTLTTSSATTGEIRVLSRGTLQLDTSTNNDNILLRAGSGSINLSSGTTTISGNVNLNSGTLALNGIAYTFPGTDSANGVLLSNGSGSLSWTTLGAASITADSLDFTEFKDTLTMDSDTAINGDYSLIVRAGLGSIQNSTSGSNDLQLSAEDKLILAGASFDLSTSNGAVDIISNQRLDLSAGGTLTLDTSQNNSHIVLTPGTGNIGIGSTAPVYKLDVNGTLRTSSTARVEGALTVTTGGASVTGDLTLDGDLDFTGAQNITTTTDNLTISPTGNLILDSSGGLVSVRDGVEIQGSRTGKALLTIDETGDQDILTASKSGTPRLTITRDGNIKFNQTSTIYTIAGDLQLQTSSGRNDNIVIRTYDSAASTANGDDIFLAAQDNLYLGASALTLETTSASAGQLVIRSDGTLQLDTSANNTNILVRAGTGNLNVSSNQLYLTGNLVVTGTETFNGVTYTFPGADGSASNVLTTSGAGLLSWGTLGAGSITADSLDFTEFKDSMNLDADTSINGPYSFIVRAGNAARQNATTGNNDLQLAAEDAMILDADDFTLTTSNTGVSSMQLISKGTFRIDTSTNNTNILLLPGTGNVGIGSTAPVYKLDVNGTLRTTGAVSITGDLSLDGDLDFTGAQNITTTADNLTISPTGNLVLDTSGGTISIRDSSLDLTNQPTTISGSSLTLRSTGNFILDTSANNTNLVLQGGTGGLTGSFGTVNLTAVTDSVSAVYLNSQRGGITLSSSNASGNGPVRILSGGSLQLSTSQGNQPIYLQAGTGNLNVSSNQLYLTGNLVVTGTETFNGVAYTFPGADGSASNVLTTSGTGLLSWGTLGAASITADSLDFTEFKDELTLDADTTVNGDQSLVIRAGLGAIQNSTSGSNDLQLSAEDKLILAGASFDLSTSSGGVDILSAARIDLSGRGTLTLDTSQSNSHIVLTPGTGNIGIGSTAPVYKLDVNGTLRTTSTARIEGALTVTTGGASVTGDLTLDGDLDFTGAQNITTTADNLTISPTGNLILDGSAGLVSVRDGVEIQGSRTGKALLTVDETGDQDILTASKSGTPRLTVTRDGNIKLHQASTIYTTTGDLTLSTTSGSNDDIVIRTYDSAASTANGDDIFIAAQDNLYLGASSMTLETTSGSAGQLVIRSDGTLQLDTSANNTNLIVNTGSGNIDLNFTGELQIDGGLTDIGSGTYTLANGDNDLGVEGDVEINGNLQVDGTITGATAFNCTDCINFDDLADELNLDADTSINGPYSFIIRSGNAARQNATSGNNDLQLAAEDAMILDADDFTLTTSNTGVSSLQLISKGVLRLDTSTNNNNILLLPGTGNVGISQTSPTYKLDITGDIRSTTGAYFATSSGNVGVGTNAPTGILDILGQCVARGTMIRRKRRRKYQKRPGLSKKGRAFTDNDFEDVPVEEIAAGDEILTLDEQTGKFIWQKVEKTMDKGIQATFELVTASGKKIETTGEHPYLTKVQSSKSKVQNEKKQPLAFAFVDETGSNLDEHQPYFGVGNLTVTGDSERFLALNRQLRGIFMNAMAALNVNKKKIDRFEFKFKTVTDKSLPYYLKLLKAVENNLGSFNFTAAFAKPQKRLWKQYLEMVKRIVPGSGRFMVIADYLHQPRGERSLATVEKKQSIEKILPIEGQGSIFLQLSDIFVGAINFRLAGRKGRNKRKLAKRALEILRKLEQKNEVEVDCVYATSTIGSMSEFIKNVKRVKEKAGIDPIYAANGENDLWSNLTRNSVAQWRKVSLLKPGMLIATVGGPASADGFGEVKWERIASIKQTGRKQVYDLQIAATHNFVAGHYVNTSASQALTSEEETLVFEFLKIENLGSLDLENRHLDALNQKFQEFKTSRKSSSRISNFHLQDIKYGGIVAHNTSGILMRAGASSLQLSSSATSTTADIQLAAADRIDLFASTMTLSTSSTSAGELKLTSKGSLILDTSGAAGGGAPIVMLGGNVGIGTTGPTARLDVYDQSGSSTILRVSSRNDKNSILELSTPEANSLTAVKTAIVAQGVSSWDRADLAFVLNSATDFTSYDITNDTRMIIKNSGNVGIGTTSPQGILDVLGSCVTGDTLLPIRRKRRRRKDSSKLDNLDDLELESLKSGNLDQKFKNSKIQDQENPSSIFEDIYEYLLCRIDEILPGDEVMSLNEATGALEYSRINKLMDKGIKSIYELTTVSGKKIKTTGLHPYLVMPRIQELDSNLLFDSTFRTVKRAAHNFYFNVLAKWDPFVPSLGEKIEISRVGWDHLQQKARSSFDHMARYFALPKVIAILQDPEIKPIYERGKDKIKDVEFWHFLAIIDGVAVKLILRSIGGERKHLYSIIWKGEVSNQKKRAVSRMSQRSQGMITLQLQKEYTKFVKALSSLKFGVIEQAKWTKPAAVPYFAGGEWKKVIELKEGQYIAVAGDGGTMFERIASIKKLGDEQVWDIEVEGTHNFVAGHYVNRKTGQALTAEQEELVAEYKKATSFEAALSGAVDSHPTDTVTRLTENKSVVNSGGEPENRTLSPKGRTGYRSGSATMPIDSPPSTILAELKAQGIDPDDIRFGGIVAHNTSGLLMRAGASSLQLSSSATSTTADIQLAAADRIDLFASTMTLSTSSTTAGELKFTSKGSLILDTSGAAGGGAPIVMLGGNVGIGTTGPSQKLEVTNGYIKIGTDGYGVLSSLNYNMFTTQSSGTLLQIGSGAGWTNGISFYPASANPTMFLSQSGNIGLGGAITNNSTLAGASVVITAGNVGIGTTAPAAKLDVSSGRIKAGQGAAPGIYGDTGYGGYGGLAFQSNEVMRLRMATNEAFSSGVQDFLIVTRSQSGGISLGINPPSPDNGGGAQNILFGIGSELMRITSAGNVGIGTSTPLSTLDVLGSAAGILMRAGASSLQLSSGTTSTTADIELAAADQMDLFAGRFSLTTSSSTAGDVKIDSAGTLTLSTSRNNTNIKLMSGTGNIQVSSNQLYLTGNLVVTGTETFNGVAYTFPGADGSASNVLTTSGAGLLSWGTLGAGSITADSLDFTEFKDSMNLDADTSINGPYSFIVRAGNAARQDATSGNNDLQLSAEDQILIHGTALTLETSSTTAGQMLLRSDGSMTFDTSGGTGNFAFVGGNVGIGTTGPGKNLAIQGSSNPGIRIFQTGGTNNWDMFTDGSHFYIQDQSNGSNSIIAQNSGDVLLSSTRGNVGIGTTSPLGKLDIQGDSGILLKAGAAAISLSSGTTSSSDLQLAAADRIDLFAGSLSLQTSSTSAGDLKIISKGSLILDTSSSLGGTAPIIMNGNVGIGTTSPLGKLDIQGDSGILLKAGAAAISLSSGTTSSSDLQLAAADRIDLFAGSLSLQTSSTSAGDLKIISKGSLILDTSSSLGGSAPIIMNGNVGIGTTGPAGKLQVFGGDTYLTANTPSYQANQGQAIYFGQYAGVGGAKLDEARIYGFTKSGGGGILAFYTSTDGNGGTERVRIDNSGNVGIGTTSPQGILDVLGSCVTGDTLLPIRRRRRKKKTIDDGEIEDSGRKLKIEDGENWDYLLCRIDQILPGDEVMSLNEATGALEYSRINTLKDMGVKEIYELTTKSGRVIRTTAEHPYLVEMINQEENI